MGITENETKWKTGTYVKASTKGFDYFIWDGANRKRKIRPVTIKLIKQDVEQLSSLSDLILQLKVLHYIKQEQHYDASSTGDISLKFRRGKWQLTCGSEERLRNY